MEEDFKNCPLRKSLKVLGGKWNMILIQAIGEEERRFGEIKRAVPDISEKVLIEKLKELTHCNIVDRKDYQQVPPKVSYQLTEKGKEALNLVHAVSEFGENL